MGGAIGVVSAPGADTLAIIGSGKQALPILAACAAVRDLGCVGGKNRIQFEHR